MDNTNQEAIQRLLQESVAEAEALQVRLEAGEDVSEDEMTAIAKRVAEAIEEANSKLREMIGPVDSALLREKIVENMTPEEFDQWSEDNAHLQRYRSETRKREGQDG